MEGTFNNLKTIHGASDMTTYVVVAEDSDMLVAIKPEAGVVNFDPTRKFFQIGFRVHVRPKEGKQLPDRDACDEKLGIGYLAEREGNDRFVGYVRIPACNITLSPWVVHDQIAEHHLVEQLVNALLDRLEIAGLAITSPREMILTATKEQFIDLIPDNKMLLPEVKVYFGKEDYYPTEKADS